MFKKLLFPIVFFVFTIISFSQTIAYSTTIIEPWAAACTDLSISDHRIIGHQLNVTVSYYLTENDASNQLNQLPRFFSASSNPEFIYARVDNNLNSDFAIAPQTMYYYPTGGQPPPPGFCSYELCDADNNGTEIVSLENLFCGYGGLGFPDTTFCASNPNDVVTLFYVTEEDATNEVNEISTTYTLTGYQDFYYKIKNVVTDESSWIGTFSIDLITCTVDTDADGIPDLAEDANRNLNSFDDDTDKDGLKNYEDADDDGDNILSIHEDYNNNGDPSDDDTDFSGVADYLEANVTLSTVALNINTFKVFPIPAKETVFISSPDAIIESKITLYSIDGKQILQSKERLDNNTLKLDVSSLQRGIYFINVQSKINQRTFKIILK